MQKVLEEGGFRRECVCGDLTVEHDSPDRPHYGQDIWRKPAANCRVEAMPECPNLRASFSVAGSLLQEFESSELRNSGRGLARQRGFSDDDRGALNEKFEVFPGLPRRYAYNFISPEGDTDKQANAPPKGLRLSVGSR